MQISAWRTTYQPLVGGYLSVDLFFVLSGFVIALSYEGRLRRGMTMPGFYARAPHAFCRCISAR